MPKSQDYSSLFSRGSDRTKKEIIARCSSMPDISIKPLFRRERERKKRYSWIAIIVIDVDTTYDRQKENLS